MDDMTLMNVVESQKETKIVNLAERVATLEFRLKQQKKLEDELKALKDRLYDAMEDFNVKSWEMPDGTKITRVEPIEPTEEVVKRFDTGQFKMDEPELYELYCKEVIEKSRGRKGYVKVTPRKS